MKRYLWFVALLATVVTASATVYDVGPAFAKTNLRDVPWATLNPSDVVNIHTKPGGYHEIIQVSQTGTAAQHIVIHGVPDPVTGALPILDGNAAITDPTVEWRNSLFASVGVIVVSPRATGYVYGSFHISYLDIENLDIRNALYGGTLTDKSGIVQPWDGFACGIYVEWAHDLAVRGCEISNCCNGFFANSKNGSAQASARLLIEHNYFHDNSLPYTLDPANPKLVISNGYHEHHCYVESAGITYQYNHFGKLRPGCHGAAIKDRSSGQTVRYNDFDLLEEGNAVMLLEPEGGAGWVNTQPNFQQAYVYGNQFTIQNYTNPTTLMTWGSFGGVSDYPALKRGVLHFYHNTIVNHHARVSLFVLPTTAHSGSLPVNESVDCRNNLFFTDTSIQSNVYNAMTIYGNVGPTLGGGNVTFGPNWISPGWQKDSPGHPYGGSLSGTQNFLVGDNVGANNPRFVNSATRDYHVLTGSNILDAAAALAVGDPPVAEEYLAPQTSILRPLIGSALDLGAVESSGTPPAPPVGGSIAFSSSSYTTAENSGSLGITVTRSGGSVGSVSVVCSTSDGSANSPSDFTGKVSVLTWAAGDTTPRTFTIPITNDSVTELAEALSVVLSNITGGAGYGPNSQCAVNINDDDVPPSQPIVAITANGVLIRFTSGAPGTILSQVNVTNISSPETLRGLAFRRTTGQLYVVGAVSGTSNVAATLYLLNPATAVLTSIATMTLAHPSFDLGFDPVTDQLHLFGSTGQHLRIDPNSGAIIASDVALAFAAGDVHFGAVPGIVGADFTPGFSPTVYAIDKTSDSLVRIGSAGSAPLNSSSGQVTTIGLLGKDTEGLTGLDFTPGGSAFAVLNSPADITSNLYTIDTNTGHATPLGTIGVAETVRDLVVATPGQISLVSATAEVTEGAGSVTLTAVRTGGSWGQTSVSYATANGTASAGSDYTIANGVLTWQDGEIGSKSITLAILADTLVEGDETFDLTLSGATNGALLISPYSTIITIHERPYDIWKNAVFGVNANISTIAGDHAAPAGDGVENLIKYALGMNPNSPDLSGLPIQMSLGAYAGIGFTRAASDVQYQVEVSDDLISWSPGTTTDVTPAGSAAGWTVIRDVTPVSAVPQRFMHLKVSVP